MIILTLDPEGTSRKEIFEQAEVIIGSAASQLAHFKIDDATLKSSHVKILIDETRSVILNVANDPFTSLNGIPFGRKTLKTGDRIQIGNHIIEFEHQEILKQEVETEAFSQEKELPIQESVQEEIPSPQEAAQVSLPQNEIKTPVEPKLLTVQPPLFALPSEPIKTVHQPIENGPKKEEVHSEKPRPTREIKKPAWNEKGQELNSKANTASLSENWKRLAKTFVGIAFVSLLVCGIVYWRASGINSQEEKKIAAGMSDIAMAITHAQRNHIAPSKQNWVDPDFIRSNLACVLSPNLHSQAELDAQGQFTNYPYILRTYTSNDMGRFLVIAQPAPNFFQWLAHKKTIVIDSSTMEMRKISDLKTLNRLLTNPAPFEGQNGLEITKVIKQGHLISLKDLSGNKNNWGFAPPKSLGFTRPGAENYIYNAPRYYPFGESVLSNAIALFQNSGAAAEVLAIQDEINALSEFPELILYTSHGLQTAIEAQKALATLVPNSNFLVGYIKFDSMGYVESSHIFMNDDSYNIALLETNDETSLSRLKNSEMEEFDGEKEEGESSFEQQIDPNHPLYLRLHAIASTRARALTPLSSEIIVLIQKQNKDIIPDFYPTIAGLLEKYQENDISHRTHMAQELAELYQEYSEMPLHKFMRFIEASNLTSFVNETLIAKKTLFDQNDDSLEAELSLIESAPTLAELDSRIQEMVKNLNLEKFPDPDRLIILQQKLNLIVLNQLAYYLLSSDSPYYPAKNQEHDRTTLIRILKAAWVTDPGEFNYFVNEFDHLANISH